MKTIETRMMVIGSGMAGMAAALFASEKKIDTVQVGVTGEINFSSGLLDLLGVHPVAEGIRWADPWDGIEQLVRDEPNHPYGLMSADQIQTAMDRCLAFLEKSGLPYRTQGRGNAKIVTPAGTVKTTYAVPRSMFAGVKALADGTPALLVDFEGLKGFSARQIMSSLGALWPTLRRVRIPFPGSRGELYTEHAARALDVETHRKPLADAIKPHIGACRAVGLPAILGIYRTNDILEELQARLGVPVFEVPTMVPAITGLRLRETFERHLPRLGVQAFYQQKVLEAEVLADGSFRFLVGHEAPRLQVRSEKTVMASGRFFGKGLRADRLGIRETIFNLPVDQPAERRMWHRKDLLHSDGHPINRAGLTVDARFRPTDQGGQVIHHGLHVAGSILAHQDWIRQKCGSGISIATAFGAVNGAAG